MNEDIWKQVETLRKEADALINEIRKVRKWTKNPKTMTEDCEKQLDYLRNLAVHLGNRINELEIKACEKEDCKNRIKK